MDKREHAGISMTVVTEVFGGSFGGSFGGFWRFLEGVWREFWRFLEVFGGSLEDNHFHLSKPSHKYIVL